MILFTEVFIHPSIEFGGFFTGHAVSAHDLQHLVTMTEYFCLDWL